MLYNVGALNGSIPISWCKMVHLKKLWIRANHISGALPTCTWPELQSLDLGDNEIRGTLPEWPGWNLTIMWLAKNQLGGTIPASWGRGAPAALVMSNNNGLRGCLPKGFERMMAYQTNVCEGTKLDCKACS